MSKVDEYTLSCYLDATLDYEQCQEVAHHLEEDDSSREAMIELLNSHILLKSLGRQTLNEKVPEKLKYSLHQLPSIRMGQNIRALPFIKPLTQIAVAIALVFAGFFSGNIGNDRQVQLITSFPDIPVALEETINEVLEYKKSGTSHDWVDTSDGLTATVTPVRSYRDSKGGYYRFYFIDLQQADNNSQLAGVAYRTDKKQWQTRSVFLRNGPLGSNLL